MFTASNHLSKTWWKHKIEIVLKYWNFMFFVSNVQGVRKWMASCVDRSSHEKKKIRKIALLTKFFWRNWKSFISLPVISISYRPTKPRPLFLYTLSKNKNIPQFQKNMYKMLNAELYIYLLVSSLIFNYLVDTFFFFFIFCRLLLFGNHKCSKQFDNWCTLNSYQFLK